MFPDISPDNSKILYTGVSDEDYGLFCYDLTEGHEYRIANTSSNTFYPVWLPENKIIFTCYHDMRYGLNFADSSKHDESTGKITEYEAINYPEAYFDKNDMLISEYTNEFRNNFDTTLAFKDNFYAGSLNLKIFDLLSWHSINFYSGLGKGEKDNDYVLKLDYDFQKYKLKAGIGASYNSYNEFRLPFVFNGNRNDKILADPENINQSNHYEINIHAGCPITEQFLLTGKYSLNSYEDKNFQRVAENFYLSLNYNKSLKSGNIVFKSEENFTVSSTDPSGESSSLWSLTVNSLNSFSFSKMNIAINAGYGKIFGSTDEFRYISESDNKLMTGKNFIKFRPEIKLTLLNRLITKKPFYFRLNDFNIGAFLNLNIASDSDIFRTNDEEIIKEAGLITEFRLYKNLSCRGEYTWLIDSGKIQSSGILAGLSCSI